MKENLIAFIEATLPAREAGVLLGMVLGEKAGFSKEFYTLLKNSGLLHLMVASGSNVMLLGGGVIEGLAEWVGRKWAIGIGMVVVWLYAGLTEFEVPIIRAILMFFIFYWAQLLGRKFNLVRALVLVLIIMAVADVAFFGEVGFWLSFLAFVGVVTYPGGSRNKFGMTDLFRSGWVSLWVTPVLGLVFGEISIIGPILNAMVMFLTAVITGVGMVGVLLRLKILLWLLEPVLFYIVKVVEWGGSRSWATVGIGFNWSMVVGWYLILIWILIKKKGREKERPYIMRNKHLWLFVVFMTIIVLIIYWPPFGGGKPKLVFCDVGQGDGLLFTTGSFQFVYDVGPENLKMAECLGRYVPFWDKKIEFVVVSHHDKDHEGGLVEVRRYYEIEQLYYPEDLKLNDVFSNGLMSLKIFNSGTDKTGVKTEDDNEGSVVGMLVVGEKKVLLTGDAPIGVEQRLVWRGILSDGIDILKVGHHGSRFSTGEELLEVIKPKMAVIGVGRNSFGHPSGEVLDRLTRFGVEVKRTDRERDVIFDLDR